MVLSFQAENNIAGMVFAIFFNNSSIFGNFRLFQNFNKNALSLNKIGPEKCGNLVEPVWATILELSLNFLL